MRTSLLISVVLVAVLAAAVLAAPAGASVQPGATPEFVPFVTDFGLEYRPAGEPVVINGAARTAATSWSWADTALGSALGFALALLAAGAVVGIRRARAAGDPVGANAA